MPDLADIVQMKSSKRYAVDVRPLNCDTRLGEKERCPHCKQFHLRLGYCQALDPVNSPDHYANTPANVLTDDANTEAGANAEDEDKAERRKAYQRELMRKRRAEGKA